MITSTTDYAALARGCTTLAPYEPREKPEIAATNGQLPQPTKATHTEPPGKHGSRFQTLNTFIDESAHQVDTTAQATWFVLFRETKPNGLATVSQGQIAKCIGVTRRTVVRAMAALTEEELVEIVRRGKLNGGPSTYRVHGAPQGPKEVRRS